MFTHQKAQSSRLPSGVVKILAKPNRLGIVFLCACFLYTFYSLMETSVEKTRISENALLPGLVDDLFDDSLAFNIYMKRLWECGSCRTCFIDFLAAEMQHLQLEVGRQNFTAKRTPLLKGSGENVYGIVRAVRNPPFESILFVVQIGERHTTSIALALSLANYAKKQIYWARDIIFLFVDGDKLATEAWMSAFIGYKHNFIMSEELTIRSGPIIGAIVFDAIGTQAFNLANIRYGMVNGRLPNLDLVNLFILLAEKYGLEPTVYNIGHPRYNKYDYMCALATFIRTVISQSFIELEGLHSIIGGYGVNAVTVSVRGLGSSSTTTADIFEPEKLRVSRSSQPVSTVELIRVAEAGLRSLNNILEKFHQSYFLYILPQSHSFISVAFYMPIIGLFIAPMIFFALHDWLRLMHGEQLFTTQKKCDTMENTTKSDTEKNNKTANLNGKSPVISALFTLSITHLISLLFYALQISLYSGSFLTSSILPWKMTLSKISTLTISLPALAFLLSLLVGRIRNNSEYFLMRFFVACEIALFIGCLSLLNFALAFSLSVLIIPFALFVLATGYQVSSLKKFVGFSLLNPIVLALTIGIVLERNEIASFAGLSIYNFELESTRHIFYALLKWINQIVENHFIHDSALFSILTIAGLSITSSLLQILVYENIVPT